MLSSTLLLAQLTITTVVLCNALYCYRDEFGINFEEDQRREHKENT